MAVQDKAYRLFEYISQVFAIDLPVERDVRQFNHELWWQADIIPSQQCRVKEFYDGIPSQTDDETTETVAEDLWLVVSKRAYDGTPELPFILKDWVDVSSNPIKEPIPKPSLVREEAFERNPERLKAFDDYLTLWLKWKEGAVVNRPKLPIFLDGWLDKTRPDTLPPEPLKKRQIEEKFQDDKVRVQELKVYVEGPWKTWSEKVKPFYTANILYDQLFSLYQTLSVEGDRLEIVWGHILLSWGHSRGNTVYYPLLLTPMNLSFEKV